MKKQLKALRKEIELLRLEIQLLKLQQPIYFPQPYPPYLQYPQYPINPIFPNQPIYDPVQYRITCGQSAQNKNYNTI